MLPMHFESDARGVVAYIRSAAPSHALAAGPCTADTPVLVLAPVPVAVRLVAPVLPGPGRPASACRDQVERCRGRRASLRVQRSFAVGVEHGKALRENHYLWSVWIFRTGLSAIDTHAESASGAPFSELCGSGAFKQACGFCQRRPDSGM